MPTLKEYIFPSKKGVPKHLIGHYLTIFKTKESHEVGTDGEHKLYHPFKSARDFRIHLVNNIRKK